MHDHPAGHLLAVGLNLLWPGLGQLHQGRVKSGTAFGLIGFTLGAGLAALPEWRAVVAIGFLAVAFCAIADVLRAGRAHDASPPTATASS